ncbi:MAG TPA: 4-hydroxy-tetrahydrodipicolinate synthase [Chitinispirillaceae bacterium]|nr:4-hydroxy-tetrahydrodipicolinate synthase [Chitinispirillaceae bacterium]
MDLKGCYVAIITPFDQCGNIDQDALRKHVNYLVGKGVAGIVPCGTTGESATLSWEEHNAVIDIVINEVNGRVKVIAGAGSNNTVESISAARHAKKNGADAILCITPYYNRPTQEGLYQHYKSIATNVDIPIVVYNVPGRTGTNLLPETLERLCELPTIVAVKEASGNINQISEIHRRCADRLSILSGDDSLTLPILSIGGTGVISVVSNIVPEKMCAMIDAFFSGNLSLALKIHENLLPLNSAMFIETNPIPVKTAMNILGLAGGTFRLPLVSMSERNKQELINVLRRYNLTAGE